MPKHISAQRRSFARSDGHRNTRRVASNVDGDLCKTAKEATVFARLLDGTGRAQSRVDSTSESNRQFSMCRINDQQRLIEMIRMGVSVPLSMFAPRGRIVERSQWQYTCLFGRISGIERTHDFVHVAIGDSGSRGGVLKWLPHSLKRKLVVTMVEDRRYRRVKTWLSRFAARTTKLG